MKKIPGQMQEVIDRYHKTMRPAAQGVRGQSALGCIFEPRSAQLCTGGKGRLRGLALACVLTLAGTPAQAAQALGAVATNFAEAARALEARFEAESPHRLRLATGSTGKLYAQIRAGAPYDFFLAADADRPHRLETERFAAPDTRFAYARGRLVLWSPDPERIAAGPETLKAADFRALALANPDLAPYGAAARDTLQALGLLGALQARIVLGENIGQAFALVETGNAPLGFVAQAQLRGREGGSRWVVPAHLHAPIRQEAVLLARGAENAAARAFLTFLHSAPAQALIREYGFEVP